MWSRRDSAARTPRRPDDSRYEQITPDITPVRLPKPRALYAATVADARRHAQRGNCVAIDVAGIRWGRDLEAPYGRFVCQKCNLDAGPGPVECPRCQAPLRRPVMMGGMIAPPR